MGLIHRRVGPVVAAHAPGVRRERVAVRAPRVPGKVRVAGRAFRSARATSGGRLRPAGGGRQRATGTWQGCQLCVAGWLDEAGQEEDTDDQEGEGRVPGGERDAERGAAAAGEDDERDDDEEPHRGGV